MAVAGIAVAATAFVPGSMEGLWSTASADQRFVAAVTEQGRTVPSGENAALVVRAAQKLCERRDGGATAAQRRATALTSDEITAVRSTFGDDSEAFMKVAMRTYCPL